MSVQMTMNLSRRSLITGLSCFTAAPIGLAPTKVWATNLCVATDDDLEFEIVSGIHEINLPFYDYGPDVRLYVDAHFPEWKPGDSIPAGTYNGVLKTPDGISEMAGVVLREPLHAGQPVVLR